MNLMPNSTFPVYLIRLTPTQVGSPSRKLRGTYYRCQESTTEMGWLNSNWEHDPGYGYLLRALSSSLSHTMFSQSTNRLKHARLEQTTTIQRKTNQQRQS